MPRTATHHARSQGTGPRHQATETRSLTQGTGAWAALQRPEVHTGTDRTHDNDPDAGSGGTVRAEVTR